MKTILAKIIVLLICLIPVAAVSATTYAPGVKVGDWAKYVVADISWASTQPGVTKPPSIIDAENTDWIKIEVQTVSGTTITMSIITRYKNGTQKTDPYNGDVKTGSGNLTGFLISGGLNKGEKINEGQSSPAINDTVARSYAGASRSVNWMDYRYTSQFLNISEDAYWDQSTGILCEIFISSSSNDGAYTTTISEKVLISETNLWAGGFFGFGGSDLWIYVIIAAIVIVVIVALVFILRRRKAAPQALPTTTVTQPPPPPPSSSSVTVT